MQDLSIAIPVGQGATLLILDDLQAVVEHLPQLANAPVVVGGAVAGATERESILEINVDFLVNLADINGIKIMCTGRD